MKKYNCYVDLHIHLDGSISLNSCKMLAKLQNIEIPGTDEEILDLIQVSPDCRDLNEFLTKFDFPCSLLQTKEGLKFATLNLLNELMNQGNMYAELRFAPQLSTFKGLTQTEVVEAALEGMREAEIPAQLILCTMRGQKDEEVNLETVRVAKNFLGKGVCAVDLAGAEALFPNRMYENVFKLANELNVPITIHSGEALGPESVWKALEFNPNRIGHGVRAVEDETLIKVLAEKKIPLELCPSSNICTCIYKDISEYPLKKLCDAGIVVTINTDDSAVIGNCIEHEYELITKAFNLDEAFIKQLMVNSVNSSFASESLKQKMLNKIDLNFREE